MDSKSQAIAAVEFFIETFNAQDHKQHAQALNYPHIRLANGNFTTIESAEQFESMSRRGEEFLEREGWHHSVMTTLDVVHAGEDKVHMAITNDRCREDGTVYKTFDTLWIATCVDGKWGIQFRSSYLT